MHATVKKKIPPGHTFTYSTYPPPPIKTLKCTFRERDTFRCKAEARIHTLASSMEKHKTVGR